MPALGSLLTAVETKTRSPQTMGLDTATPGIGVFHRMFSPVVVFHLTGVGWPSATPAAFAPRKEGQFCAWAIEENAQAKAKGRRQKAETRFCLVPFAFWLDSLLDIFRAP